MNLAFLSVCGPGARRFLCGGGGVCFCGSFGFGDGLFSSSVGGGLRRSVALRCSGSPCAKVNLRVEDMLMWVKSSVPVSVAAQPLPSAFSSTCWASLSL